MSVPKLAIIVPTYNEKENLPELVERIDTVCTSRDIDYEIIVVDDDSPDGTAQVAKEFSSRYPVKVIIRKWDRGLATAAVRGMTVADSNLLLVMDADLSHAPEAIPDLLEPILQGEADLTVGSRYVEGGKIGNWSFFRRLTSRVAILLARPLTSVRDITSGFFCLKRFVIVGSGLSPVGYKIGLEIMVKGKYSKVKEVPITFVDRGQGKSKFGLREQINYMRHLLHLYSYRFPRLSLGLKTLLTAALLGIILVIVMRIR